MYDEGRLIRLARSSSASVASNILTDQIPLSETASQSVPQILKDVASCQSQCGRNGTTQRIFTPFLFLKALTQSLRSPSLKTRFAVIPI